MENWVERASEIIFVILRSPTCGRYTIITDIRHNYYVTVSGIDFDIDVLAAQEADG
jgi:hypothetical protein